MPLKNSYNEFKSVRVPKLERGKRKLLLVNFKSLLHYYKNKTKGSFYKISTHLSDEILINLKKLGKNTNYKFVLVLNII